MNISFGKKPVLDCIVKTKENEKRYATLYKMDHRNPDDRKDIASYRELESMRDDFFSLSTDTDGKNFYVLKDNETDDVISSAQTSKHFARINSKYPGPYISIDEISKNKGYFNPTAPVIGKIVKDAYEGYDKNVLTGFNLIDVDYFKKYGFSKRENEGWVLPERRFRDVIEKTQNINRIHFYG